MSKITNDDPFPHSSDSSLCRNGSVLELRPMYCFCNHCAFTAARELDAQLIRRHF